MDKQELNQDDGMQDNEGNSKEKKVEQDHSEKPQSALFNAMLIGFFGGVLWSAIGQFTYYFNFSEFGPKIIVPTWLPESFSKGWGGALVSFLIIGVISIIVALVYYVSLRKVNTIFAGAGFGIAIWAIVFFAINPFLSKMDKVGNMETNTIITTLCLYLLYGVFIGYSISYDEYERNFYNKKQINQEKDQSS
ncbi:YqhR family membrane protein [Peribacillus alkalitolerans]|uniref:YqhR family membrane protein n=1 Tax=Peribacillus alkalitolerans TaxID=1550385 RepID=UPI0013D4B132|nr:YqhR family membrane protein [Peribacillus alkalitolerans]